MFNVLFVFFAMAINVSLVVHDKINLQNSADMAAYYAAMKQAEILNVIAHENYMIRQSYKLLAWRYRVLGTLGLFNGNPHPVWTGDMSEAAYPPGMTAPTLCITYKPTWKEVPEGENLCNRENLRIPPLPEVKVIAGFLGINAGIAALSQQLRTQFDKQCEKHGAYNWWFAMSILQAFRNDQRNRMQVISGLAKNLSGGSGGDFTDLDGGSVMEGARQTFLKNLTFANRDAFDKAGGKLDLLNALEGISADQWLPPIKITPTLIYTDVNNEAGCVASPQTVDNLPTRAGAMAILNAPYPQGLGATDLYQWKDSSFMSDSDYQFTIGVEKNPWYAPYVGVKASIKPRQVFFPFGSGVQLTARAFAKSFGGRIGPWYMSQWDKGSPQSSGTPVDALMAPRMAQGGLINAQGNNRLPNYSRFPGDTLGLGSKLAQNALAGLGNTTISYDYYKNIKADISQGSDNDPVAWDASSSSAPTIRGIELAAIAPDLFDITYYSIDPGFGRVYLPRLQANKNALGIPSTTVVRGDLGSNDNSIPVASVVDQMTQALSKNLQKSEAFYFVRDKANVLTSWLPGPGAFNYDVSSSMGNFGVCGLSDVGLKFASPGMCIAAGGRTGVSVKIVSRDALTSSGHKIGGANASPDAILNPPKESDGW